jgi:hypothetical protein
MRLALALAIALSLSGCGTVFDPAPYSPSRDKSIVTGAGSADSIDMMQFHNPADAARKLQALAQGYVGQRDDMLREQLIFDLPMIGLGAATIINPIFNGATNTTIGLGLGAAGAAGLRTYFGPQAKALAYNSAAASLSCAAGVATAMSPEYDRSQRGGEYDKDSTLLESDIGTATALILGGKIEDKTLAAALLVARDEAQKALGDLATAIDLAQSSPTNLQIFANAVITGTDKKVISGEQNVDAVLAALKTAPTSVSAATTIAPPSQAPSAPHELAGVGVEPPSPAEQATALIPALQAGTSKAQATAKRINTIWAMLTSCAATS